MKKTYLSKTRLLFGIVSLLFSTIVSAQTFTVGTFAGSGTSGNVNGTGSAASFNFPYGIAVDANRNVFVADRSNNLIRKITAAGEVSTLASGFSNPNNVVVDKLGNVYVADVGNVCIKKIAPNGTVTIFAGSSNFSSPRDLTVDAQGNVYVTDYIGAKVLKITSAGVVSTVAGSGTQSTTDGNGTNASFFGPSGIAVDPNGVIYVAEFNGNTIRKIATNGDVTTLAGAGTSGFADGTGNAAKFAGLYQLSIAPDGNLYAADFNNRRFRKITSDGVVSTLAGTGTAGSADGLSTNATFAQVAGIAAFNNSYFVVSDYGNHKIRTITSCTNTSSTATISSCDAYTWDGTTYTTSGTYTKKMLNATGCDSIATLNLTISKATNNVSTQAACDSYIWNGTTYTISGTYIFSYNNANGCASADTLKLTINKGTYKASTITACDSYTWNETTYNTSGKYTFSYNNANGCASVDTLHLTINNGSHNVEKLTACTEYTWNNQVYSESGIYTKSYNNENSCASVDTLKLTISKTPFIDIASDNLYSSCNETINLISNTDSIVKIDGKIATPKNLIKWANNYYDYSTANSYPGNITGAPDAKFGNDTDNSWTTENEDDGDEYISVYYNEAVKGNKISVYQNFNPGAITKVEVSTTHPEDGEPSWITIANPTPAAINTNKVEVAEFPYSLETPIYRIKISLASDSVPGYNQIDAIGISYVGYQVEKAKTAEYEFVAISKGGCSYTTTFENQNNTQYDTLTVNSCNAYNYEDYETEDRVIIAKSGVYDFVTYSDNESGCSKKVHLNFTYTGKSHDTTVSACTEGGESSYYWEVSDNNYYQSGDYSYVIDNEGCDSVVTLHLNLKESPYLNLNLSGNGCNKSTVFYASGDSSVFLNGKIIHGDESSYQLDTLKDKTYTIKMYNKNGCSTSYTWNNVTATKSTKSVSSCGDYITPSNKVLTKSGTYSDTTVNSTCDVINTIEFTKTTPVNNVQSYTDIVCSGKPFEVTVQNSEITNFYYLIGKSKRDTIVSNGANTIQKLTTSYPIANNDTIVLFVSNNTSGDAVKLDKSTDHVRFENVSLTNNTAITIEADVYFNGNNQPWAGQGQYNSDNMGTNTWLWHSGDFLVNDNGTWRGVSFPAVNKTGWVHVATVADNTGMYIYYDGVQVLANTGLKITSGITKNNSSNVVVGADARYPGDAGRNSQNAFDNFAIWSEARTESQINSDRNSCLSGLENNLILFTNFNNVSANGAVPSSKGPSGQLINILGATELTIAGTGKCFSSCSANIDTLVTKVGNPTSKSSIAGKAHVNSYPVSNGDVILYQVQGEGIVPLALDTIAVNNGNYTFNNLENGEYKLLYTCGANCGKVPTYYAGTTKYQDAQSVNLEGCPNLNITNIDINVTPLANSGSGTGKIEGSLNNGNVNPNTRQQSIIYSNVLIKLVSYPSGNIVKYTYTDANGNYTFDNLPNGDYVVLADIAGYDANNSTVYTINSSNQIITSSLCVNTSQLEIGTCSIITDVATTVFQLSVAPNPSAGLFNISTNVGDATYRVINSVGVEVFSKQITGNTAQIDLSSEADGIYILQVISDNKLQQTKLVKE